MPQRLAAREKAKRRQREAEEPPPWKGKQPKRTVQSFDLRVFDRERFGAYAIWLGHHFKRYKQEGEWI